MEAEERKKERRAKKMHLKKLRKKLKAEKREKDLRKKGIVPEKDAEVKKEVKKDIKKSEGSGVKDVLIQVRLQNGKAVRFNGKSTDTLKALADFLVNKHSLGEHSFHLLIPFPRKEFKIEDFEKTTFQMAGCVPRAALNILPLENKGKVVKGDNTYPYPNPMGRGMGRGRGRGRGLFPIGMPNPFAPGGRGRGRGRGLLNPNVINPNVQPKVDPKIDVNSDEENDIEEDKKIMKKHEWFICKHECPKNKPIYVFRPKNTHEGHVDSYKFLESDIVVKQVSEEKSISGEWKLNDSNGKQLALTGNGIEGKFEILSLTNQILILKDLSF